MNHRLPQISLAELAAYREDSAALSRFEKRFAIPCQIGFLSAFAGIVTAAVFAKGEWWPILFIGVGLFLLAGGLIVMFCSTPTSESGQAMKKYWNSDSGAKGDEVIYVCEDSRTYFRRTWSKKTRSRI